MVELGEEGALKRPIRFAYMYRRRRRRQSVRVGGTDLVLGRLQLQDLGTIDFGLVN